MTGGQGRSVGPIEKNQQNIEAILDVDRDAFHDTLLNKWSVPFYIGHGKVFGLFHDGSLKGFTIFLRSWDDPQLAYLVEIAVRESYQGRGGGTYLLQESISFLKGEGISSIALTVDPRNARAMHIYQDKFGFRFVEFRKDEYGKGIDRYYLKLDLNGMG